MCSGAARYRVAFHRAPSTLQMFLHCHIRTSSSRNLFDDSKVPSLVFLIDSDGATGTLDTILGYDSALIEAFRFSRSSRAPLRTGRANPTTFVKLWYLAIAP